MKEKNKKTLDQAIERLKVHEAPRITWDGIELELEKELANQELKSTIEKLPTYQAPTSIWDQIEQDLDAPVVAKKAVIRSIPWRKIVAAAALVGVTLWGLQWGMNSSADDVKYSYSEELINDELFVTDWNEDEDAFEMVLAFCKMQKVVCQEPEFRNLKIELDDLNDAREALVNAMESYGKDADIITQLTQVEYERSTVLKKMIERI